MADEYTAPVLESRWFPEFKSKLKSMGGKVVAVTGCTTGTGNVCAQTCAELGAKVIMLNRASERADAALESIRAAVPGADVSQIPCDLMNFASVREAIATLNAQLADQGLDVLCNNAGIMATTDKATEDGCDTQMQTNHLSHFLLTGGVWPLLEQAAAKRGEARVVNHSSSARKMGGLKLDAAYFGRNGGNLGGDDLPGPFQGPRYKRYQQSKLANVVFTYALDEKAKAVDSNVKSFVCEPGGAVTGLAATTVQEGGIGGAVVANILSNCQSGEDGTMPLLTCCCIESLNSRDFYAPEQGMVGPAKLQPPDDIDDASKELLWRESVAVTEAQYPF